MNKDDRVYFDLERKPLKSEREEIRRRRMNVIKTFFSHLFVLLLGLVLGLSFSRIIDPDAKANIFDEIKYVMNKDWLYSSEFEDLGKELEYRAIVGMTSDEDDPYTSYMSKEEMEEFASAINLDYVGIGVQYSSSSGVPIVLRVFKESPAEKAGMQPGDIIKAIDGVQVDESNIDDLKELVTGERGSVVELEVQRGNQLLDLKIVRDSINSTVYASKEDDYVILEIDSFGESTALEIEKYLKDYEDISRLIIDLRNDTGGYQTSVRDCLRLFIGVKKPYLKQVDVHGNEQIDYTTAGKVFENFRDIVILTNKNTASAAEVFALVMKEEMENVTLVGETTFGKGVIQTNKRLSDGGILKLTSYYWYSPQGTSVHKEGIKPDIEIMMPDIYYESYYSLEEDETFEYDSVDDSIRVTQMALDFLGYDVGRKDGYFDQTFAEALNAFKLDSGLSDDGILDSRTFEQVVSRTRYVLSTDKSKDSQLMKAIEVLHEN
ncbi:MAG: PDZ domain-containing protein [Erysipelotrichaceae bacterium]|nr:PDZ domain-containing protein [Erysipelotrichaceae bacterium]